MHRSISPVLVAPSSPSMSLLKTLPETPAPHAARSDYKTCCSSLPQLRKSASVSCGADVWLEATIVLPWVLNAQVHDPNPKPTAPSSLTTSLMIPFSFTTLAASAGQSSVATSLVHLGHNSNCALRLGCQELSWNALGLTVLDACWCLLPLYRSTGQWTWKLGRFGDNRYWGAGFGEQWMFMLSITELQLYLQDSWSLLALRRQFLVALRT